MPRKKVRRENRSGKGDATLQRSAQDAGGAVPRGEDEAVAIWAVLGRVTNEPASERAAALAAIHSAVIAVMTHPDQPAGEIDALRLIQLGLAVLADPSNEYVARIAREIVAQRDGFASPDSPAAKIVQAAEWVEIFSGHSKYPKRAHVVGDALVLRLLLEKLLGEGVPCEEELAAWLAQHSVRGARGKITTAGIVARIIHRGRLLGAGRPGSTQQDTLDRVSKALARRGKTVVQR